MIEVFKITHGFYDEQVVTGFLQTQSSTRRGHKYTLYKRSCKLDLRKYSFTHRVVDQWNCLPDHVVDAKTILAFEKRLDRVWKDSEVMYNHEIDLRKLKITLYWPTNNHI